MDIRDILTNTVEAIRRFELRKSLLEKDHIRPGLFILIGTVPTGFVGILLRGQIKHAFSDPSLVTMNLLIAGLFIFLTRLSKSVEGKKIGIFSALIVGLAR